MGVALFAAPRAEVLFQHWSAATWCRLTPNPFTSFLKVKYKEDLEWLRGLGCYAWDTPTFALAEKNKVLYSGVSKTAWIVAKWFFDICLYCKFFSGESNSDAAIERNNSWQNSVKEYLKLQFLL